MIYLALLVAFLKLLRWFFDPYFRYRDQKKVKQTVLYEEGKVLTVQTPHLLDN